MKTRRKLEENNSKELEDLFSNIFCLEDRITFSEIRQHAIFRHHFPGISEASVILYNAKFNSTRLKNSKKYSKVNKSSSGVSSTDRKSTV